ncbi:MAG TPA: hypothetical protein VH593_06735, partial [Ktedonobacteraceae bacterium]
MLREKWGFRVAAVDLEQAIKDKIQYHEAKVVWWTQKVADADQDVRTNGLDTSVWEMGLTNVTDSYSYSGPAQPKLDQAKVRALNEA